MIFIFKYLLGSPGDPVPCVSTTVCVIMIHMPYKGTRRLTPTEKANIVIAREMRGLTGKTNADIGKDFGISGQYVQHMTKDNIPAEAKKIYKKKRERLEELAFETTVSALKKGKELIDIADSPKALSGIAAVGKMADTVYRLETNRPTEIQQALPTESHALEFIRMLLERMDLNAALDSFMRASLDPLVPEERKPDIRRRIETGELKLLPA
jgi:hypothetical protein